MATDTFMVSDNGVMREASAEEAAEIAATQEAAKIERQQEEQARAEIAAKREAAKAKLSSLGLTEDDLVALGLLVS